MKHISTRKIPASIERVIDRTTCDLCKKEIKQDLYDAEEVEIKRTTGNRYPEGGSGEYTTVDMCGQCFEEKLVPWLISQGAQPRKEEWEF